MMMMTYATHNIAAPHQTYFKWGEHTFSIRIGGKRRRSRPWLANCDLGVWASTWCGGPVDCYRLIRRELRAAHCICTALGPAAFRPTVSSWRLDFLYSVDDRVNYACFECICAPSVYPLVVWSARFAVAALALCAARAPITHVRMATHDDGKSNCALCSSHVFLVCLPHRKLRVCSFCARARRTGNWGRAPPLRANPWPNG